MESKPASFTAKFFSAVGLGAKIPKPSGPHLVRSFHFRIPEENGVLSQVFFPVKLVEQESGKNDAKVSKTVVRRVYRNGVLRGISHFSSTPRFLFEIFLGASPHPLGDVPANAPPVVHERGAHSMPLIVFSHGLGGNCEVYTKACSDLASNGYIVVALEHEDGSGSYAKTITGDVVKYQRPPQGMPYTRESVINFRAPFLQKREQEIRRAVNFFTISRDLSQWEHDVDLLHCLQSIDPQKVFLAGHSFGGASTVHTVRAWPNRFAGAIIMDLWPFPIPDIKLGIKNVPVCSVLSEDFFHGGESNYTQDLLKNSNNVLCNYYVPGSVHSSFSDTPFWAPSWIALRFKLRGPLDAEAVQNTLNRVYVSFIDEVCKSVDAKSLGAIADSARSDDSLQSRLMKQDPLLRLFFKAF